MSTPQLSERISADRRRENMAVLSFFFLFVYVYFTPSFFGLRVPLSLDLAGVFFALNFCFSLRRAPSSLSCCSRAAVCNSCQEPLSVTPARGRCDRKPGRMSLSVRKGATCRKAGALTTGGSYRPWNVSDGFYRLKSRFSDEEFAQCCRDIEGSR